MTATREVAAPGRLRPMWVAVCLTTCLCGCAEQNKMGSMTKADVDDKHVIACGLCYDETKKELAFISKAPKSRGRKVYRSVRVHHCDECKTGAEFFEENGVLKFRCSRCAPAGVACDKCAPPDKS